MNNGSCAQPKTNTTLSASQIRLKKDLDSLELPPTVSADTSGLESSSTLFFTIHPDEGYYKPGYFRFSLFFKDTYPIEPPAVKCVNKIYHPNIDTQGNVCLNILREDWSPVLDLQSVVIGLLFLFLEPNDKDPLNRMAAQELSKSPADFKRHVQRSLGGNQVHGEYFDYVLN